ncbi:MAG: 4Fe-4S dicluster domain-containing protein [Nitrospirae bacterium]|nr:4Fe-4S dicluster domain-containing protein [Nitrospirota bacterium]
MSEIKKGRQTDGSEHGMTQDAAGPSSGLTRRNFLSMSMLAGCAAIGVPSHAQAMPEFEGWPKSYGMLTDFTACVGCRSCERACNEANKMPAPDKPFDDGSVFEEHRWPSAKALTVVNRYKNPGNPSSPVYRKIQCNHCLEPACATACPIHAYTKTPEGAVIYNKDLCFGCRYCVIACPFNMPGYDYESPFDAKIVKCIFCYGRIKEGQIPACAEACPGGALTFGRRADLLKLARKRIVDYPEKYIDHIYGEYEVGGTSWIYISGVPFEHLGFPTNLPKKPLIELSKGYLSMVPVIFTTFPALFGALYAMMHDKAAGKEDSHDKHQEVHNG